MILIEHILGNAKKDPSWKQKLEGANVDLLVLDQREAQKSRCRRTSLGGLDLGISLERNVVLGDGDILLWDEATNTAVVVQLNLRDVMVIDLKELKQQPLDVLIKTSFELGHALGNQHWKAVTKHNEVYIPLTVETKMMDSVMRTHGFQHLPYAFVAGAEILPLLTTSEARLLFGGAEETDTHVHVASPQDKLEAAALKIQGVHSHDAHSHSHDNGHSFHSHKH
ncbi:urease accessory protein UreE [Pseudomonas deceptionensis]|uniref:Urease accessory protein n=1 Tax=Pseudomonas deceptionensis TaxID=882211 RepID=A0A0J6GBH1_PSEDM|nr:urease accessory protein UreE [Pseudomonas deceptionensis]KMM79274.1 urease accessory protein UreE [Pseudomonas deceptionensis]SEF02990.1 urease accessory protein [Pseudomonas deceptionensis]